MPAQQLPRRFQQYGRRGRRLEEVAIAPKTAAPAKSARSILSIPDIHCASCVSRVEKTLSEVPGVLSAQVHFASKSASIEFDPLSISLGKIQQTLEKSGYKVSGVTENYAKAEDILHENESAASWVLLRRLLLTGACWIGLWLERPLMLSEYTVFLFGTVAQVWGGLHFHKGLVASLRHKAADMNTLVSLSTWAAYLYSAWVVFFPELVPADSRSHQLEALTGLIFMVTLGRWLEVRFRLKAGDAIRKLLRLTPKTVRVLRNGAEVLAPLAEVAVGERIIMRPGEQVGLDGVVEEGHSMVDEAVLTGESLPVEKGPGARVFGGTMNKNGSLIVIVKQVGEQMVLAKIIEAVRTSAASKAPVQKLADRVAAYFVPAVAFVAVTAFIFWLIHGQQPRTLHAVSALVSVLAVACPCSLGLATPLAILLGTWRSAELGVFFRNADVLEKVGRVDTIVFDKTGTLTEGKPSVMEVLPIKGIRIADLVRDAITADQRSEHPYADALRERAKLDKVEPKPIESFEAFPGKGVAAVSGGRRILVGSISWLAGEGVDVPNEARLKAQAGSFLGVALDGQYRGAIVLADQLRPTASQAVAKLKSLGFELVLASGDRNQAVCQIAQEVGIGKAFAEVLPEDKLNIIRELQSHGKRVAMVGEGFNDAPALAQADIGVALAGGTDVAVEAADITLMKEDLNRLVTAIDLSRRIRRVIFENLAWAFAYNVVLIPVAAGALVPSYGIDFKPQWAGAAMALSSISVVLNSMKLWGYRPWQA